MATRASKPFPKTRAAMLVADYLYCHQGVCRGCGAKMEWWRTPTGAKMPMNPMLEEDSPAVPHWATCAEREQFQKKKSHEKRSIHIV